MQRNVTKLPGIYFIAIIPMVVVAISANANLKDATLAVYYSFDEGKGNLVKDG